MPKPNFVAVRGAAPLPKRLGGDGKDKGYPDSYIVTCVGCSETSHVPSATQDYFCSTCGATTPKMRERASVGLGRTANGIVGMLTAEEKRGVDYFDGLTNSQWSRMHSLWLEALRAKLPVIEMSDREIQIRFEVVREMPNLPVYHGINAINNPIKFIRLIVSSRDGRVKLGERIDPYIADRRTVQAMFLALQSILVRIPAA